MIKNSTPLQIRFTDIDWMGHVNNAIYLNYFELGRMNFFNEFLGKDWDWFAKGIILVKNEVEYRKPLQLTDNARVETFCTKIGSKSFELTYQVIVSKDNTETIYTEGKSKIVCFNFKTNESQEVYSELKDLIETN